jgi:hypothetical protein
MFPDSTASAGFTYSVVLVDTINGLDGVRLTDLQKGIVTEARVRFIQAFDIGTDLANLYVTQTANEELSNENRLWISTTPTLTSPYITLQPGTSYITVATRDPSQAVAEDTVIFGPVALDTVGGDVLSALILDPAEGEDQLSIINDLMP